MKSPLLRAIEALNIKTLSSHSDTTRLDRVTEAIRQAEIEARKDERRRICENVLDTYTQHEQYMHPGEETEAVRLVCHFKTIIMMLPD